MGASGLIHSLFFIVGALVHVAKIREKSSGWVVNVILGLWSFRLPLVLIHM